jgi:hypothetical protein
LAFFVIKEKLMKKILVICSLLFCSNLCAASIEPASGIHLRALNGEGVDDSKSILLINGDNQLVLDFTGRLKISGKREHISTVPYIVIVNPKDIDRLEVQLVSQDLDKIKNKIDRNKPIFEFLGNGKKIDVIQFILPPNTDVFPYANIPEVVRSYNQKNGLIFDSGKIRELKKELKAVNQSSNSGNSESENSLQLKLWYSRATEYERRAFQKWIIDHN